MPKITKTCRNPEEMFESPNGIPIPVRIVETYVARTKLESNLIQICVEPVIHPTTKKSISVLWVYGCPGFDPPAQGTKIQILCKGDEKFLVLPL